MCYPLADWKIITAKHLDLPIVVFKGLFSFIVRVVMTLVRLLRVAIFQPVLVPRLPARALGGPNSVSVCWIIIFSLPAFLRLAQHMESA